MLAGPLFCALLTAGIAHAEPEIGSLTAKRKMLENHREDASSARATHMFVQCLYHRRAEAIRGALTALAPADQERYEQSLHKNVECLGPMPGESVQISASRDVMRGMYAEAALESIHEDDDLRPLPAQPDYVRDWFVITGRPPVVDEMAVCVADQNPQAVRALLATEAETPKELAAVQALGATLGPCLPQGATLKANRQSLRAALAEALYHRAVMPAPAAAPALTATK